MRKHYIYLICSLVTTVGITVACTASAGSSAGTFKTVLKAVRGFSQHTGFVAQTDGITTPRTLQLIEIPTGITGKPGSYTGKHQVENESCESATSWALVVSVNNRLLEGIIRRPSTDIYDFYDCGYQDSGGTRDKSHPPS